MTTFWEPGELGSMSASKSIGIPVVSLDQSGLFTGFQPQMQGPDVMFVNFQPVESVSSAKTIDCYRAHRSEERFPSKGGAFVPLFLCLVDPVPQLGWHGFQFDWYLHVTMDPLQHVQCRDFLGAVLDGDVKTDAALFRPRLDEEPISWYGQG